jgi:hypothetical protein
MQMTKRIFNQLEALPVVAACSLAIVLFSCSRDEIPVTIPTNEAGSDQACLTFFRNGSKNFTTYLMSDTRGTKIFDGRVGNQEWMYMTAATVGKRQFIVGHNGKSGLGTEKDFSIRLVTNRGEAAEETQTGSWERNYENLMGFHVDDKGFIFGQDSYGDHKWFTQEVLGNGTLAPAEADFGTWARYYETATPIYVDGKTYLIFHCSGSVNWFIARVWFSGKISVVSSGTWGRFWDDLTAVQVGGNAYLVGMADGPGGGHGASTTSILFVQRVNADGTLGEETETSDQIGEVPDLSNIMGYECGDKAYVFGYCEGITSYPYFIREVTRDGHIQDVSSGTFDTDFQFVFPLHVYDPGNFRYIIGTDMSQTTGAPSFWSNPFILPWSGETRMGGGAALAQVDGDAAGKLDAVMVGIQRTVGPSYFYYKVAYNLTTLGEVSSWSPICWGPEIGWNQEGAGADIADIDGNGIPDLLLMCVDAPSGSNSFRYYIGWNMGSTGQVASWSPVIQGPTVGYDNSGGGAALGDIDGNGRPEVVFMGIDNTPTDNYYWYTIGLNLDVTGKATAWTDVMTVNCDLGWSSAGGGAALADVNHNGKLDLILMNIDSPSGANPFLYHVGWDIDINGNRPFASNWSSFTVKHLSNMTNGGGLAVGRLDNNDYLDILLMSLDNPYGND